LAPSVLKGSSALSKRIGEMRKLTAPAISPGSHCTFVHQNPIGLNPDVRERRGGRTVSTIRESGRKTVRTTVAKGEASTAAVIPL